MASLKWESQRIKHCRPRVPQWLNCAVIQCSCLGHWMTRHRFRRLHSFSQHCPWYRWRLPKRSRNPSGSSPYLHIQRVALHRAATTKNSPKFEHPGRLSSFLFLALEPWHLLLAFFHCACKCVLFLQTEYGFVRCCLLDQPTRHSKIANRSKLKFSFQSSSLLTCGLPAVARHCVMNDIKRADIHD